MLPVITPRNVKLYIRIMATCLANFYSKRRDQQPKCFHVVLWSWCDGPARLTLTMSGLPVMQCVLFPVDLRYGWVL